MTETETPVHPALLEFCTELEELRRTAGPRATFRELEKRTHHSRTKLNNALRGRLPQALDAELIRAIVRGCLEIRDGEAPPEVLDAWEARRTAAAALMTMPPAGWSRRRVAVASAVVVTVVLAALCWWLFASSPESTGSWSLTLYGKDGSVIYQDTGRCATKKEYRVRKDLPPAIDDQAFSYRLATECDFSLFENVHGRGRGEHLLPTTRSVALQAAGVGSSIVAYSVDGRE